MVQWLVRLAYRYWDLGSIPRSPCIFHNFFFNLFLCSVPFRDLPCTQCQSLPHVQQFHLMASTGVPSCTWVNGSTRDPGKVKKASIKWAKMLSINLHIWVNHPPCLHFFLSFIFFYLFFLINCFI